MAISDSTKKKVRKIALWTGAGVAAITAFGFVQKNKKVKSPPPAK